MALLVMVLHKDLVQLEGYANHLVNVQVFTFIISMNNIILLTIFKPVYNWYINANYASSISKDAWTIPQDGLSREAGLVNHI